MNIIENDKAVLAEILSRSTLVEIERGERVHTSSQKSPGVVIVSAGALGIYVRTPGSTEEALIAPVLRNGRLLLISDANNNPLTTARALATSNAYVLPERAFEALWNNAQFVKWYAESMAQCDMLKTYYSGALHSPSLADRVIQFLRVSYLQVTGREPWTDFTLDWPINQTDFADMLGASRPYLNLTLKNMVAAGQIQIENRQITARLKPINSQDMAAE